MLTKFLYQLGSEIHPHLSSSLKGLAAYHYSSGRDEEKALELLLRHITKTVPFYQQFADRRLSELPIVNREIIGNERERFLSSAFKEDALYWGQTSGSTGEPFVFALDKRKKAFRTAEMIFYNGWAGYELGDKFLLNSVGAKKSRFQHLIQRCSTTDPSFIDEKWMATQKALLIEGRMKLLVAYASTIKDFAEYCRDSGSGPNDFSLKGIITTSENLDNSARDIAIEVFGCPVLSRYSSLETGVLSHECPEYFMHHLNEAAYVIELLGLESDQPVGAGQPGRVVVTDLYSYGMPLVRYETGDIAVRSSKSCECDRSGPIFSEILGRTVENITSPDGRLISWVRINDAMWAFADVQKFQFIQLKRSEYEMRVVLRNKAGSISQIKTMLRGILGSDADVSVTKVDSIARSRSGKQPYIINRYAGGLA